MNDVYPVDIRNGHRWWPGFWVSTMWADRWFRRRGCWCLAEIRRWVR